MTRFAMPTGNVHAGIKPLHGNHVRQLKKRNCLKATVQLRQSWPRQMKPTTLGLVTAFLRRNRKNLENRFPGTEQTLHRQWGPEKGSACLCPWAMHGAVCERMSHRAAAQVALSEAVHRQSRAGPRRDQRNARQVLWTRLPTIATCSAPGFARGCGNLPAVACGTKTGSTLGSSQLILLPTCLQGWCCIQFCTSH